MSLGVKVTVRVCLGPAFSTVPAAGVYAKVPGTEAVASSCAAPSGVPATMSVGLAQMTVAIDALMSKLPVALLAASVESPAKLARTAPTAVPAWKPARLTSGSVATPLASVVADPTFMRVVPLVSAKATVIPASGVPAVVRVAVSVAVLAYAPLPATADKMVDGKVVTVVVACAADGVAWTFPT